jgi:hypothetical protein
MLKRKLLTERELAQILGCSLSKLRSDRWKGIGIPYLKLSKSVRYWEDDAEAYCQAHRIDPQARRNTSERAGQ